MLLLDIVRVNHFWVYNLQKSLDILTDPIRPVLKMDIVSIIIIIILHTVIRDHYGRLDLLAFCVWLRIDRRAAAPDVGYIKWRHIPAQSATIIGITEPYPFTGMRSFTMPGDDQRGIKCFAASQQNLKSFTASFFFIS